MFKATTFDTVGGPEFAAGSVLRRPGRAGPHAVRLDVEFIGLNRPDMRFRSGIYPIGQWS